LGTQTGSSGSEQGLIVSCFEQDVLADSIKSRVIVHGQ